MNSRQSKDKHLGLIINEETHAKLMSIAKFEGRTGNAQILHLIDECIKEYELEHGPIKVEILE